MNADILAYGFQGTEVRTVTLEDEPWFVAADVAAVLGYRMASDLTRSLDDDEKGTHLMRTIAGDQAVSVVNEAGLFKSIVQRQSGRIVDSDIRTRIKAFQRWVTHEVLPQIRRTGSYTAPGTELALDTNAIKQLHAAVTVLLEANERQAVEVAELTPRADAWDAIASADGDYSVGEAAKMLSHAGIPNMGPQRLFSRLEDIGWTFRAGGVWQAKADRVEKGFLSIKPQFHYHPGTGQRVVDPPQVRVTLKGVEQLRRRLGGGNGAIQAVAS